jgi:multisubunit Na+/H+ antiporter MnhG subunit
MGLDIRLPIGLFFSALGLLLGSFGIFGSQAIYTRSLGINVNLAWGVVLLIFGGAMISLALLRRKRIRRHP